jgi:hypothetical protein
MAPKAVLVLFFLATVSAQSHCKGDGCNVEVPADEVSLMQMKMEVKDDKPADKEGSDLDGANNDIAEDLGEASRDLEDAERHFMNETMGACPPSWDTSIAANAALKKFIDTGCLVPQDPASMSTGQKAELSGCGQYNSASQKQGQFAFTQKATGTEETGGVCATKAFVVKSPVSAACKALSLFRAYSDPPAFSTKCAQWGGFWGPSTPNGMNKATYRTEYAICDKWNPRMNKVAKGNLNDAGAGAVVLIGNGEAVKQGVCGGSEKYDYSSYLQVVMCRRPSNCANFPMDVTVSNYQ